jgi:hypothetical protein
VSIPAPVYIAATRGIGSAALQGYQRASETTAEHLPQHRAISIANLTIPMSLFSSIASALGRTVAQAKPLLVKH